MKKRISREKMLNNAHAINRRPKHKMNSHTNTNCNPQFYLDEQLIFQHLLKTNTQIKRQFGFF